MLGNTAKMIVLLVNLIEYQEMARTSDVVSKVCSNQWLFSRYMLWEVELEYGDSVADLVLEENAPDLKRKLRNSWIFRALEPFGNIDYYALRCLNKEERALYDRLVALVRDCGRNPKLLMNVSIF